MNPLLTFLKNTFAQKRILGEAPALHGQVKADARLQALVEEGKIPGLAITVLKEGRRIFQKGYGYSNVETGRSVDPERTIFRIASVSKPIAATALACMIAERKIDLDTSFYEYVPYYPRKKWDFTIRQLAAHTAGIRSYRGKEYVLNEPYGIKEGIAVFMNDPLLFKPGSEYHYNSYGWILISLAIQEINAMPFESYVKNVVLEPLGMTKTFTPLQVSAKVTCPEKSNVEADNSIVLKFLIPPAESKEDITAFYSKDRSGFRTAIPVNNMYKLAGGGYLSTVQDVAILGQTYLDEVFLEKDIQSQFLTAETIKGKSTYYGMGWQVSRDTKGRPYYGHIGNGVGGYSNLLVYPEQQMVFSILINCTDPGIQDMLDNVIHHFLDV